MSMHENAQVDINVNGKSAQKQLSALEKSAEKYKKELVEANRAGDLKGYKKAKKNLDSVNKEMRQLKKQTFDVNKVVNNLSTATYNDLRKSARKLNKELNNMERNTKQYAAKKKQLAAVRGEMSKHRNELRGTNKLWANMKGMLPALGIGAAVAAVGRLIGKWTKFQEKLRKTKHQIETLTGATGNMLDELTAKVDATAKTFDQDFGKVAESANVLAKQMQISYGRAMELIQTGFANGADSSGEFLDMLKEYPAQLKEVGLNAEETITLMTQQVEQGVFSDKGIDAIKEAGISLREMTKPTKEAIEGIGLTAEQIQKVIDEEGMIGAIKLVSERLNSLKDNSPAVGAAIADIFKGPGEDAGLAYLKTLKDINVDMDELQESTGEYAQTQKQLVEANERVSQSMNAIFGDGSAWANVKVAWKQWWAHQLDRLRKWRVALNKIGRAMGFDVKPLTEFSDTIIQTNPELRKLADTVQEFGTETDKGREALTKLNSKLYEAYGSEGLKMAQEFTEEQKRLSQERIQQSNEETDNVEQNNKEQQRSFKDLNSALEKEFEKTTLHYKQQLAQRKISQEQYESEMRVEELAYLSSKKALYEKFGRDTLAIEQKIADKQIEMNEEITTMTVENGEKLLQQLAEDKQQINRELEEWENQQFEKEKQDLKRHMQMLEDIRSQSYLRALANLRKALDERLISHKEYVNSVEQLNQAEARSWAMSASAAVEGAETTEDAAAAVMNSIRNQIKAYLAEALAGVLAKALASVPFPFNLAIAATAAGAASALFDQIVPEFGQKKSGTLDVIGEEDGKTYRNVPYQGEVSDVGIANQGRPTIINEQGGELIADAATTKNVQMNAPELIDQLKSYQVPQRAEGTLKETKGTTNNDMSKQLKRSEQSNRQLAAAVNRLIDEGIQARYGDDEIRNIRDKSNEFDKIERDASWD